MTEDRKVVEGEVEFREPGPYPITSRRQGHNHVVGKVQGGQVCQLSQVTGDLCQLVMGKIETFQ